MADALTAGVQVDQVHRSVGQARGHVGDPSVHRERRGTIGHRQPPELGPGAIEEADEIASQDHQAPGAVDREPGRRAAARPIREDAWGAGREVEGHDVEVDAIRDEDRIRGKRPGAHRAVAVTAATGTARGAEQRQDDPLTPASGNHGTTIAEMSVRGNRRRRSVDASAPEASTCRPGGLHYVTSYDVDVRRGTGAWTDLYDGTAHSRVYNGQTNRTDTVRVRACNANGCSAFATDTMRSNCGPAL